MGEKDRDDRLQTARRLYEAATSVEQNAWRDSHVARRPADDTPPPVERSTPPPADPGGAEPTSDSVELPGVEFVTPDWSAPFDPEPYLLRVPARSTAKGMFFRLVQQELQRAGARDLVPEAAPRYQPFYDYPYIDLLKLELAACPVLYPDQSLREGLRRLGRLVFPMFVGTMIGSVMCGLIGRDPKRLIHTAGKAYGVAASVGTAKPRKAEAHAGILRLQGVPNFPTAYHVGVIEGCLIHCEYPPRVDIAERGLFDVDIRAVWTPDGR